MEVHVTPEPEAQLAQIANTAGNDPERLLKEAARFRTAVREGIAQADPGEFIEEKEMDGWTPAWSRCCAPKRGSEPSVTTGAR